MKNERILAQLETIFRDVFDDENLLINRSTSALDIEDWDSLAQINLVVASEKHFNLKFSLSELALLNNVGDIVDLIVSKMN
jgi:acyl carrier protein